MNQQTKKPKQLNVFKAINFLLRQEFNAYQLAAKEAGRKEILTFEDWLEANKILEDAPSSIITNEPKIIT